MKKRLGNGKQHAQEFIEAERKLLTPKERKLLKLLTKHDKNEKFRKVVC